MNGYLTDDHRLNKQLYHKAKNNKKCKWLKFCQSILLKGIQSCDYES